MGKMRIAVWGISDGILGAIQAEIDPRKAEIVLFIDNDKTKQGTCYMNVPVVSPLKKVFDEYAIDAYLITVLSAYRDVERQLMNMGVSKEQIHMFVAEDICKFCVGPIDDIDMNFIKQVYFEPNKILGIISQYKETYESYSKIQIYDEDTEAWFHKSSLISHACGGMVGQRKLMYSNSKEAFQYSMDKEFKLLECDVLCVGDNEWILGHDYKCFYEAEQEQYSMMTLKELLERIKQYKDVHCLIDTKWKDHKEYGMIVDEIDKTIKETAIDDNEQSVLKKQIVMEVYDEMTIKIAKEHNFEMIFTQYRNPDWQYFMNTVVLCYKYGIRAIALPVRSCFCMEKFMKIITDKRVKIFTFSTDSLDEYFALKKMGVTGIFTNYLTENDFV